MRMKKDPLTLALGDIRWETTPTGTSLGGAAAAFAARLAALGRSVRCAGIVGADSRGDNALVELAAWRVDTALVQRDIAEETESVQLDVLDDGTSVVRSHTRGAAANFAWTPELQEAADELDVLFWSSVTQRDPISAETFSRFLEGSPPSFKVFDIDCASGIPTQGELEAGLEFLMRISPPNEPVKTCSNCEGGNVLKLLITPAMNRCGSVLGTMLYKML